MGGEGKRVGVFSTHACLRAATRQPTRAGGTNLGTTPQGQACSAPPVCVGARGVAGRTGEGAALHSPPAATEVAAC